MIPFIAGIVWMFASDGSFASKVFTVLSVILIITSVILTTNIYLTHMSLFEWIVILVLIFGGAGFTGKVLFAGGSGKKIHQRKEIIKMMILRHHRLMKNWKISEEI